MAWSKKTGRKIFFLEDWPFKLFSRWMRRIGTFTWEKTWWNDYLLFLIFWVTFEHLGLFSIFLGQFTSKSDSLKKSLNYHEFGIKTMKAHLMQFHLSLFSVDYCSIFFKSTLAFFDLRHLAHFIFEFNTSKLPAQNCICISKKYVRFAIYL